MRQYLIKPVGDRDVSIERNNAETGQLGRARWTKVKGRFDGQSISLEMPLLTLRRRWFLRSGDEELAVARNQWARPEAAVKFAIRYGELDCALLRPYFEAFEWRLFAGDEQIGTVALNPRWQHGERLPLDVELAEDVPQLLAPFVGYLTTRAFTERQPVPGALRSR